MASSWGNLIDSTSEDYDLMADSPTQNYATLNPLQVAGTSNTTLTNANLRATNTSGGAMSKESTITLTDNEYYWENTVILQATNYPMFGIVDSRADLPSGGTQSYASAVYYAADGSILIFAGTNTGVAYGDSFTVGDVIGVRYNAGNGEIRFYKNGDDQGLATTVPAERLPFMTPGGQYHYDGRGSATINFGQQPFLHRPAELTDANNVQTQNLPEATILNGRDHFQALTGPGSGAAGTILPGQRAGDWSKDLFALNTSTATPPFNTTNKDFFAGGGGVPATPAIQAFDGATGTYAGSVLPGTWVVWRPEGGIQVDATITIEQRDDTPDWELESVYVNENLVASNVFNPTINFSGNLTNLALRGKDGNFTASISRLLIDGEVLVDGNILSLAQQTFRNGLWWIKDRVNSNQHQLVDSVRGGDLALTCPTLSTDTPYIEPAGNSVAWCWNAPEAWTDNSGTLAASGQRNLDAGFSIVSYTGDLQPGATVAHGLTQTPELIIVQNRDDSSQEWHVRHKDLGGNQWTVRLNMPTQIADFNSWNNQPPNENHIVLGPVWGTNGNGNQMIAYCWHSVPGYSAFGSYVANNDPSGPMIWTGFRPAWILLKRIDLAENWAIYDTTRDVTNPAHLQLFSDRDVGEDSNAVNNLDILSNGFKLRTNDSRINTGTLVYACFAENPFGASNTAPANAR